MRLINKDLQSDITHGQVSIHTYQSTVRLTVEEDLYINDDDNYITKLCPQLISASFDDILIGGLNLGLIPFYLQNNSSYSSMTVVESNLDIINCVEDYDHLNPDIVILHEDFKTYTPSGSFDLIVIDLHWGHPYKEPNWESEIEELKTKYIPYLKEQGTLLVPLTKYSYTPNSI